MFESQIFFLEIQLEFRTNKGIIQKRLVKHNSNEKNYAPGRRMRKDNSGSKEELDFAAQYIEELGIPEASRVLLIGKYMEKKNSRN